MTIAELVKDLQRYPDQSMQVLVEGGGMEDGPWFGEPYTESMVVGNPNLCLTDIDEKGFSDGMRVVVIKQ